MHKYNKYTQKLSLNPFYSHAFCAANFMAMAIDTIKKWLNRNKASINNGRSEMYQKKNQNDTKLKQKSIRN